jgi:hypothetical protein
MPRRLFPERPRIPPDAPGPATVTVPSNVSGSAAFASRIVPLSVTPGAML